MRSRNLRRVSTSSGALGARVIVMALCAGGASAPALAQAGGSGGISIPSGAGTNSKQPEKSPSTTPTKVPGPEGVLIDLRPKFRLGQEQRYVLEINSSSKLTSGGVAAGPGAGESKTGGNTSDENTQLQRMTQTIGLVFKTRAVDDQGTTVDIITESVKIRMETDDFVAEFDSAKPRTGPSTGVPTTGVPTTGAPATGTPAATNPTRSTPTARQPGTTRPATSRGPSGSGGGAPARTPGGVDPEMSELLGSLVAPMVGSKTTYVVGKNGEIKNVSSDSTATPGGGALTAALGQLAGTGGVGGLGGGLGGGIGGGGSSNWMLNGSLPTGGLVRVGQSWTSQDRLGASPLGDMAMTSTHTLRSASGGVATVGFTTRMEPNSAANSGSGGGLAGAQLDGASGTGTYRWDLTQGSLIEMSSQLNTTMRSGGGAAGGLTPPGSPSTGGTGGQAGDPASGFRMTSSTDMKIRRR